jgi:hypothetical protein
MESIFQLFTPTAASSGRPLWQCKISGECPQLPTYHAQTAAAPHMTERLRLNQVFMGEDADTVSRKCDAG